MEETDVSKRITGSDESSSASRIPIKSKEPKTSGKKVVDHTVTMKASKLSRTVGPKELKENLPRNNQELSSTGTFLPKLPPHPKRMGFMEMKRVNQDLVTELQAVREASALMESKYQNTVDDLTQEIKATREFHAKLKREIRHYQDCLAAKNSELDALQLSLEEIKFENQRLASVLEGARIDALTGVRIEQSKRFADSLYRREMDLSNEHSDLDHFITSLQSTISLLQEQESGIVDSFN